MDTFFQVKDLEYEKMPFASNNKKVNMPKDYPIEIQEFVSAVKSDLLESEYNKGHPNLTDPETEALEELITLQKAGKLVIQPADKGSGICIYDRRKNNEGSFQTDERHIKWRSWKKYISKDLAKNLLPKLPKAGAFYLQGKVHKEFENIPKGRPFIPGGGTNTEHIS